jgi:outer membrane immunogenic protein
MKRILLAGAFALVAGGQALAADLPPPPPPPRAPATYVPTTAPVYNWSGIYIGANGGYAFGTTTPTGGAGFNTNGFLAGGTVGGNIQWGGFVLGAEGDWDWSNLNGTGIIGGTAGTFNSNWLATARGRAGWAFDRVLLYGTGGGAFANAGFTGLGSTTMDGWTAGGGLEFAFAPNWTAKAEYLYVDFSNPSLGAANFKTTENVVRAGVNFKFAPWW